MGKRRHDFKGLTFLAFLIFTITLAGGWVYEHPMWMSTTNHHAELGEDYNAYQYLNFLFLSGNDDIEIMGEVNTGIRGVYKVDIVARAQRVPVTITVSDTKPPEIVLKEYEAGIDYVPKAEDFIERISDASLYTIDIKEVEHRKIGESKIWVSATDEWGNKTVVQTKLTRKASLSGKEN